MTRGKIVFIDDEKILCSVEFNGDMGLEWFGKDVIAGLGNMDACWQYMQWVSWFNAENFGYEEVPWACIKDIDEDKLFDMSEGYFDKWFSDYLYIKNNRNEDFTVIDRKCRQISIHPNGILALCYGEFDEDCKESSIGIDVKELSDKIVDICESKGWFVTVDGDDVELQQYSPLGEDFFFSVRAKSFVRDVLEYAHDFNPDKHAEMWVESRGTNGVPNSIRQLIDDADAIADMLDDLAKALPDA